ncbi:tetratricopeptide repeat protein [Desulfovibrio sp. OttesenSCG-928-G15]|nr:tetratricopeptide repeat protein [Desulfovibrio sp. OttesenSCG-928-G15]
MQYSSKDYEFMGKQVAAGLYVGRTTFLLALVMALLAGMCLGRYVFPFHPPMNISEAGEKRPLGAGGGGIVSGQADKQLLQSIFQHEEDLRKDPNNVEAWEHLGNLYYDSHEPEKAIRAYTKALELNPRNTSVLVDCGLMYRQLKQFDTAVEFFGKVLALDPKHQIALFNTGVVLYFDLGQKEKGLEAWNRLMQINPDAKTPSGEPLAKLVKELS